MNMKFNELFKLLEKNKYYIFSYNDLFMLFPSEKKGNIKKLIYRWKKNKWVSYLKKGLYELTYPKDFGIPDMFISNKLYYPSYISMETALSNYSIIPEVSMTVTSVTTKSTRRFKNKHGLFTYRSVQPPAFTGYYIEKYMNKYDIRIAEPEKALVDYLHFNKGVIARMDTNEERLDLGIISNLKKIKLEKYAKAFNLDLKALYAHLWFFNWTSKKQANASNQNQGYT